jgi:hypothetical protein
MLTRRSVARTFSIAKLDQQITFDALADRKFGDADFNVAATASSNLAVSLAAAGNCTLNGSQIHDGCRPVYSHRLSGRRCKYKRRRSVVRVFSIAKSDQQITFEALADKKFGDADFNVTATASSNLAVSLAAAGNCTLAGNQVHLTGAGQCTITASQDGDANTNAAAPVARGFSIGKSDQQITFDALADKKFGDADFGLTATTSSNLPVSLVTAGNCTLSGSQIHLSRSVHDNCKSGRRREYECRRSVARTFSISKAGSTRSRLQPGDKKFGDADFAIVATASSNLLVTLARVATVL